MEEIGLKMFGSRDPTIVSLNFLSDGDSVNTRENLYENLRTPAKMYLICTGIPVENCGKFGKAQSFEVRSHPQKHCQPIHL